MYTYKLEEIKEENKNIFNNLFELYQYDFSEYYLDDVNDDGLYGHYKYIDEYFKDDTRHAYYIKVDGKYTGFVLINRITFVEKNANTIAEFFILKKYRRQKLGTDIALDIFNRFKGKWELRVLNKNDRGLEFWKKVIENNFKKIKKHHVVNNNEEWLVYTFSN